MGQGRNAVGRLLPRALTSFVGRATHLDAIRQYLTDPSIRLVTLTGPGGVGKTRLALEVASNADVLDRDCAFISLAEVPSPEAMLPAIARQLGLRETPRRSTTDQLVELLRGDVRLLVLDNCERVTKAAQDLVDLLERCADLTILATSRVTLRVHGEQEYPVPPMALPDLGGDTTAAELRRCEAVALFAQRARAVRPSFALTDDNARVVAEVCVRLDGLPLAIELAAARVKVLTADELAARLGGQLDFLTGGPLDQPARLRSMRDAIAWSYDLLDATEQGSFRRLSVFLGGFTLDAAEAVGTSEERGVRREEPDGTSTLLDHIGSLVDHGLVQWGGLDEEPRYRMLETIREFGLDLLGTAGEAEEVRAAHAAWCVALTEAAAAQLDGPDQVRWLDRLTAEDANRRAAQNWMLATGRWKLGIRLALALYAFWLIRGAAREDSGWLERLLDMTPDRREPEHAARRARAMHLLGCLHHAASDYEAAQRWYEASVARRRALGDRLGEEASLHNLGLIAMARGDPDRACALAEEAIGICRKMGDRVLLAICLGNQADALFALGRKECALASLTEAIDLLPDDLHPRGLAHALVMRGDAAWRGGDDAEAARPLYEEALEHFRRLGDERFVSTVLAHLCRMAFTAGQHARAARHVAAALELDSAGDDRGQAANFLDRQASIAIVAGHPDRAARLVGAADALRDSLAIAPLPMFVDERESTLTAVQEALGGEQAVELRAEGRELSFKQAIAEAIAITELVTEPAPPISDAATDVVLTPREHDVLRLLIEGGSDKQIGEVLFLGHRTVATHVSNILGKFGVPTRAAAVAYALRHELVGAPQSVDTSFDGTATNA